MAIEQEACFGQAEAAFPTEEALKKYVDDMYESVKKEGIKKYPLIRPSTPSELRKWKEPYRVLHGNHRVEVAHRLGWKTVNCEIYKE